MAIRKRSMLRTLVDILVHMERNEGEIVLVDELLLNLVQLVHRIIGISTISTADI